MRFLFPLLVWLLALGLRHSSAQTTAPSPDAARIEEGRPFTREEKVQLAGKLLAPPSEVARKGARPSAQKATAGRRKVISVTVPVDIEEMPRKKGGRRVARVVVFNYGEGKAASLLVDAASAEVLAEQPIRGRPQASEEEKQDALKILRQDPELDRLVQANAVIEGGFIVDGPLGASPKHRFLLMQLLTPDRLHLQRTVTVDLTAGKIVVLKVGN